MNKLKNIFIVNPISGKGNAKIIAKNIIKVCEESNIDYEMHYTQCPKDATKIAKCFKYAKDVMIYSVGGDGTLFEIVNGIIGTKNFIGVIPAGSGNDYYKAIKAKNKKVIISDVGKINDLYFLNIVSFGIDAEVGDNIKIMRKRKIPAKQMYNASIIYTFFKYKFKKLKFILDKTKKSGEYTIVTICNGNYYGGGYNIAPNADIEDGLFDIYFVDKMSKLNILPLLPRLKKGTHESSPHVHKRQNKKIKVISENDIIANVDGEIIEDKIFNIKMTKKKINIYYDQELINKFLKTN